MKGKAAEEMRNAGVRKLPKWGKGKQYLAYTIRPKLEHGACVRGCCRKKASYSTPVGNCCFHHAAEIVAGGGK